MTTDDELLARLRRVADEVDASPAIVIESAQAAFSTRRLNDELAELLRDSDLAASSVRGAGPRLLSYETAALSLELQIDETAGRIRLGGLVSGSIGSTDAVEVQTVTTAPHRLPTDGHGWFRAEDLPAEPFRVRIRTADGPVVSTGWIRP